MSKKFAAGLFLGGATAYLTWKNLSPEKKRELSDKIQRGWYETMDAATDYAMDLLDWTDSLAADYHLAASEKWATAADQVKQQADKVADHFSNDNFDAETAEIRDALARQKKDDDDDNDIVINLDNDKD